MNITLRSGSTSVQRLAIYFSLQGLACLAISLPAHAITGNTPRTNDTTVLGSEHPEQFSRHLAFVMMLDLLLVDPDDATSTDSRSRHIMSNRIGLSAVDSDALRSIVESYRVQKDEVNATIQNAKSAGTTEQFQLAIQSRGLLYHSTSQEIQVRLSKDGKQKVYRFISEIVGKSRMIQHVAEVSK